MDSFGQRVPIPGVGHWGKQVCVKKSAERVCGDPPFGDKLAPRNFTRQAQVPLNKKGASGRRRIQGTGGPGPATEQPHLWQMPRCGLSRLGSSNYGGSKGVGDFELAGFLCVTGASWKQAKGGQCSRND